MQRIGVPYSEADRANGAEAAKKQAGEIAQSIVQQGGPRGLDDKEVVALIAYLQRLGTDLFATPAEPATTEPSQPAATAAVVK